MMKRTILSVISFFVVCLTVMAVQEKIILLNEGNWQSDNGRITYFEDGTVISNQWFRDKNGDKLGDTPNDIIQVSDNLIAIALDWSNIIQFIRPDGTAVTAIEDVPNNRKLCTDGKGYLYVSSYGHECGDSKTGYYNTFDKGFVAKIDLSTFKIVDAVEVGYEPEGIAYYDGYLFVANTGGYGEQEGHDYEQTVSVVDATTMKTVRTVDVETINLYGEMSQSGQYLLINSPGDYYTTSAASLVFDCKKAISGAADSECYVKFDFASTYSAVTLDGKFLSVGSSYSYYSGGYEFSSHTIDPAVSMQSGDAGVTSGLIGSVTKDVENMSSPYDIYVNPYTGYIYATDAASYSSNGKMYQWDAQGNKIGEYKVYINPAHFLALVPDNYDALNSVKADAVNHSDAVYNLQGQRVTTMQPGHIYIKGGKKIKY